MKGPMTTQTLRGLDGHGAMHWRGDRTGGNDEPHSAPNGDGGTFNEDLAFKKFNPAFTGLNGAVTELNNAAMQAYTDFALQIIPPPNPIRNLDDSLTPMQQAGRNFYFGPISDGAFNCNGCHTLDPANRFFGTDGRNTFDGEPQFFKVAPLRNMYAKVGMFGMPDVPFNNPGNNGHKGDQIRGFGYLHDGSTDSLFRFLNAGLFNFPGGDPQRREVEQFLFAFDSNLKPVVGQQITQTAANKTTTDSRVNLLIARAAAGDADLVVSGEVGGALHNYRRLGSGDFESDKASEANLTEIQLRDLVTTASADLTFTAVPPGTGILYSIDRDEDGVLNRDDVCPALPDPGQADNDSDGVGESCDVCQSIADADQRDSNGDGYGNRCDGDLNNDGATNSLDLGLFKAVFITSDPDADINGDGIVNSLDLGLLKQLFMQPPGPSALAP
jgi:hypothetical protein